MPAVADHDAQVATAAVEKRGMAAGTRASLILGMCLLAMMLFLGALMYDFQTKLNRLDREADEARGIIPGHCAGCGQPLPRRWLPWSRRYICSPECMRPAVIARRRRAQGEGGDGEPVGKGSHFQEMIYEVPVSA